MTKSNKRFVSIIVIVLAVIAVLAFFGKGKKSAQAPDKAIEAGTELKKENGQENPSKTQNLPKGSQVLTAILQKSDKPAQGNLMIETGGKKLYIFTNRDFSALIGKNVDITYQGTLDNFVLGTIEEHN